MHEHNSVGIDFKLAFCAFVNLATVTSQPGITKFPIIGFSMSLIVLSLWFLFLCSSLADLFWDTFSHIPQQKSLLFSSYLTFFWGSCTFIGTYCSLARGLKIKSQSLEGGKLKWMNQHFIDLSTFMVLCYLVWLEVLAG